MSFEFLLTALIVVVTPGAGVLYTLSVGLARGHRASIVAGVGCTLGVIPHTVVAITGLATLLHASALAFQSLRYLGVAYLLYMAWTMLGEKGALPVAGGPPPRSAARIIGSGILINILNPKLTPFFVAFLPQFVDAGQPDGLARMVGLSAVFMLITLTVFLGYGICAASVRRHVGTHGRAPAWPRQLSACAFVALGVRLALDGR